MRSLCKTTLDSEAPSFCRVRIRAYRRGRQEGYLHQVCDTNGAEFFESRMGGVVETRREVSRRTR
jgi:hypothetical protein